MSKDNSRKRVEKLFSEMGQPVSEPNGNTPEPMPVENEPAGNTPASLLWELEALQHWT